MSLPEPAAEPAPAVPAIEISVSVGGVVVFACDPSGCTKVPPISSDRAHVAAALAFAAARLAAEPPAEDEHAERMKAFAQVLADIGTPEAMAAIAALQRGAETTTAALAQATDVFNALLPTAH